MNGVFQYAGKDAGTGQGVSGEVIRRDGSVCNLKVEPKNPSIEQM